MMAATNQQQVNLPSYAAAKAALDAHRQSLGIEGGDDIQVWHLLVSLMHYCQTHGVDLDAEYQGAKSHLSEGCGA